MSWWMILPPVVAAIVLVMLPGLVIAYAATARGITAWGLAPGLSMTVYTVLALAYGVPHFTWNLGTVAVGVFLLVAMTALVVRLLTRRFGVVPLGRDPRLIGWISLLATAVAFAAIAFRFAYAFGAPDAISQTFDNNFHLNGMRYIIDTGEASPLTFSDLQYAFHGFGAFYPNLWHCVSALIAELSGASVPVTANAFSIVIGGLVWPLSCVFMVRQILGPKPLVLLATGAISVAFGAFPLSLIAWGVLYPNLLGLALVPAGVGAVLLATRLAQQPRLGPALGWIAFIALLPGIALAHPNAFISLIGVSIPPLAVGWAMWLRRRRSRALGWRAWIPCASTAAIAAVGYAAIFRFVRPPANAATWGPSLGRAQALFDGLLNAYYANSPAIVVTVLAAIGVVVALVKRRHRWLIISALLVEILYFLTATLPIGEFRYLLTGIWYSDIFRVIALFPLVLTPLAVIGVIWIGESIARLVGGLRRNRGSLDTSWLIPAVTVALILLLGSIAQSATSMRAATAWARSDYLLNANSRLLSTNERTLLERLPSEVPAGAVIAGDPWTGTSLAWALADRRVIAPHIYVAQTPATARILHSLRKATPGSAVCKAVKKEGVTYALDFGTNGVFGETAQYPGVHHLNTSKAITLVDHVGSAKLYRITGCD